MAFSIWKIGLHIQQHEVLAVVVSRDGSGWFLPRWWRMPLARQVIVEGHIREPEQLAAVLMPWSRELPRRHHIYLSFPANRTLQKKFPRPAMTLREPEQTAWLSGSMARELDMEPDALNFDYSEDTLSPAFNVTAAQSKEISALLTLMQTLKVQVAAITPDASALQRFISYLPPHQQCLAWRDDEQWLWATRYAWGRKSASDITVLDDLAATLSLATENIALCAPKGFDPLSVVSVRQPPIPPESHVFAIALGLAMGEME
ncbi:DNA utilization protein HofM [Citrobacter freundii]|uniref:DNA utilization protein HofM n=1 Tax=Citrobacter freundii TaxID=546 RepID=UPI001A30962D|nr:DNA utilization protein HofM [Citrobacter freundii]MDK2359307.1 DNA utilization protein HofM [Citrobacter freundii]HAU4328225.1 DNA utilization protein HofM [Citrobacter freundii]